MSTISAPVSSERSVSVVANVAGDSEEVPNGSLWVLCDGNGALVELTPK